jgi:hypothetical protein
MNHIIDKIKYLYNTFGLYIFSTNISCIKSKNLIIQDNKYIIINDTGLYYIHVSDNKNIIYININNIKTQLSALNLLKLNENDIINRYNDNYFNMLICKETEIIKK